MNPNRKIVIDVHRVGLMNQYDAVVCKLYLNGEYDVYTGKVYGWAVCVEDASNEYDVELKKAIARVTAHRGANRLDGKFGWLWRTRLFRRWIF